MGLEKLKLILNANLEYMIYPIMEVRDKQTKDATSISLPGQSYKQNVLMGISGQTADLTITYNIHDDGTDKSNSTIVADGTNSADIDGDGSITSITEQILYLKDHIQAPSSSASWTLTHTTGDMYSTLDVFFEEMDMATISLGSPKWRECTLRFQVGSSV